MLLSLYYFWWRSEEDKKKSWNCTEKSSILSACHSVSKISTSAHSSRCFSLIKLNSSSSSIHQILQFASFKSSRAFFKLSRVSFKSQVIASIFQVIHISTFHISSNEKIYPNYPSPPSKKKIVFNYRILTFFRSFFFPLHFLLLNSLNLFIVRWFCTILSCFDSLSETLLEHFHSFCISLFTKTSSRQLLLILVLFLSNKLSL